MVGDGHRSAGTLLRAAQDEAGVPPGVWKGRGLAALGLRAGDVVSERQAELLLGEGRHPDADRIEREFLAQGKSPAQASGRPCRAGPSSTTAHRGPARPRSAHPGWPSTWCSDPRRRRTSCGL
ncbi:relaxase domain-containing protein [Streptomyces lavendulocolor]|uniref:Relaxase domain-containing protein n=2 Tax=Streptomyces lavendulocolor TaxID=67316 RepID=A0ABV2WFL1_9ACTN